LPWSGGAEETQVSRLHVLPVVFGQPVQRVPGQVRAPGGGRGEEENAGKRGVPEKIEAGRQKSRKINP